MEGRALGLYVDPMMEYRLSVIVGANEMDQHMNAWARSGWTLHTSYLLPQGASAPAFYFIWCRGSAALAGVPADEHVEDEGGDRAEE